MSNVFDNQVRKGMDIYDADNEKIGTIAESVGGYMRVPSGFLGMGTEHRIPLNAIREVRGNEVHLTVSKDELDELESDTEFDSTQVERTTTTTSTATEQPMREQTLGLQPEEQVRVEKRPVVYEEVGIDKRASQETQHVSDTVRREEAVIDAEGRTDIGDSAGSAAHQRSEQQDRTSGPRREGE